MIDVPMSLRKRSSELSYQQAKIDNTLIPLNEEKCIKEWKYWKLVKNRFPYDICYKEHDMLIPKRLVAYRQDLTMAEIAEMDSIIINYAQPIYDLVFENMAKRRSVMYLFHLHFASYLDARDEMSL